MRGEEEREREKRKRDNNKKKRTRILQTRGGREDAVFTLKHKKEKRLKTPVKHGTSDHMHRQDARKCERPKKAAGRAGP